MPALRWTTAQALQCRRRRVQGFRLLSDGQSRQHFTRRRWLEAGEEDRRGRQGGGRQGQRERLGYIRQDPRIVAGNEGINRWFRVRRPITEGWRHRALGLHRRVEPNFCGCGRSAPIPSLVLNVAVMTRYMNGVNERIALASSR